MEYPDQEQLNLEIDATPVQAATQDPVEELRSRLQEEREARIRLEARLEESRRPQAKTPAEAAPTVYTRSQLRASVENGNISEDQMEEIWSEQQLAKQQRQTEAMLDARDIKQRTLTRTETEIRKYKDAYPDLVKSSSEDWRRVKREFDFLVEMGDDPNSVATEVKACRMAFGSPDRIPERTRELRPTSGETSGSSDGSTTGGARHVDIMNRVPLRLRPQYQKWVADGFKTYDEIEKELKYMQ